MSDKAAWEAVAPADAGLERGRKDTLRRAASSRRKKVRSTPFRGIRCGPLGAKTEIQVAVDGDSQEGMGTDCTASNSDSGQPRIQSSVPSASDDSDGDSAVFMK
jgi:hypothetical protein